MPINTTRVVRGERVYYCSEVTCVACDRVISAAKAECAGRFTEHENIAFASSRSRAFDMAKRAGAVITDVSEECADCAAAGSKP